MLAIRIVRTGTIYPRKLVHTICEMIRRSRERSDRSDACYSYRRYNNSNNTLAETGLVNCYADLQFIPLSPTVPDLCAMFSLLVANT